MFYISFGGVLKHVLTCNDYATAVVTFQALSLTYTHVIVSDGKNIVREYDNR